MLKTKIDLENFSIYYSHRYLSFLEHDYSLKLDKYFSFLNYFNGSKRSEIKDSSMRGYSLLTAKEELINLEKEIKMVKMKLAKIEPYIYELRPIYVASSYTTMTTYLLFEKDKYRKIILFLKDKKIKYEDTYQNKIDDIDYLILKFYDFGYVNNAKDLKYLKLSNIESVDIKINVI